MNKITKKDNWIFIAAAFASFIFIFIFFDAFHPIVILDSDDWQYVSYARPAVPYTGFWNPSRILPEILMPFCGTVAAALYHMGISGYIESQIIVFAFVMAIFVAFYIYSFEIFIKNKFSIKSSCIVLVAALFLLMHFLIFRNEKSGNQYMFWSYDATCYFYYTIPSILCCTLVMYFDSSDILNDFFKRENYVWKSVLVVIIYFAVFSNLFNSVILAVYMFYAVLRSKKFFSIPSCIVLLWIISAVFEVFGGRGSAGMGIPMNIKASFSNLIQSFNNISIYFKALMYLIIISSVAVFFIMKKRDIKLSRALSCQLFSFFALCAFEVVLCAKINPLYILRPQVMFGIIFALFMMICLCLSFTLEKYPVTFIALPIIFIVMLSVTNTQEITFAESNTMGIPWQQCVKIDNDLISQVVNADEQGLSEMTLDVMDTGWDDNWPHTDFVVYGLEQSLYKHGLISRHISITPHWSLEFNERNGLNITEFSENRY